MLEGLLKPFIERAAKKKNRTVNREYSYSCSAIPLEDINTWAPCMRDIYQLPICREGATRALAAFVSYLGQIGIERDKAYSMFIELVERWGTRVSNIFGSYYKVMCVPTCDRLTSNSNIGFPKGVSVKNLNACKPDSKCLSIPTPWHYTDNSANLVRILNRLEKPKTVDVKQEALKLNSDKVKSLQSEEKCLEDNTLFESTPVLKEKGESMIEESEKISQEGWKDAEKARYAFADEIPERFEVKTKDSLVVQKT